MAPRAADSGGHGYSRAVLEHFRRPRNAGRLPDGEPGVGTGEASGADGAERIRFQLRADAAGRVREARFKAFGCPATIACGSALTELAAGRSLRALDRLDADALAAHLSLTPSQRPLAELASLALLRARDALRAGAR